MAFYTLFDNKTYFILSNWNYDRLTINQQLSWLLNHKMIKLNTRSLGSNSRVTLKCFCYDNFYGIFFHSLLSQTGVTVWTVKYKKQHGGWHLHDGLGSLLIAESPSRTNFNVMGSRIAPTCFSSPCFCPSRNSFPHAGSCRTMQIGLLPCLLF